MVTLGARSQDSEAEVLIRGSPGSGAIRTLSPFCQGWAVVSTTSGRVGSSSLNPCSGGPHSEEADEGSSPWPTWVCWALLDSLPPSGPTLPHLLCSFLDGCPGRRLGVMAWWGEALSWESGHLGPSLSLSLPHWVALTLCFHRAVSAQRGSPTSWVLLMGAACGRRVSKGWAQPSTEVRREERRGGRAAHHSFSHPGRWGSL